MINEFNLDNFLFLDDDKKSEILNIKNLKINNRNYQILKYKKEKIKENMTLGLLRSVILKENKIMVYSPPKCFEIDFFISSFPFNECTFEEFVEGTMINLYWDDEFNKWEICTKSSIGANIKFFVEQDNFNKLFLETCEEVGLKLDNLPKEFCYSLVFQHPKNRFVNPNILKKIYLINIFRIEGSFVKTISRESINYKDLGLNLPYTYNDFKSFEEAKEFVKDGMDYGYKMGLIFLHKSGLRTKIRNIQYENLKKLRGNQPKLDYQYLVLRKEGNVKNFLLLYPENKNKLREYQEKFHIYTEELFKNYISCFVKKEKKLKDFPFEFKIHMYNLHKIYLEKLKPFKSFINLYQVINYINSLEPAQQLFVLNYKYKKQQKLEDNIDQITNSMEDLIS